ncbi:hypothetical protein [Salipaludibacillus sp. CF4.18]|uniref:hypothetical protein n=1 Tax=Salipaludibacillus sp. CF4.18 TaxID=3373081 RepID=UPI003EE4BA40
MIETLQDIFTVCVQHNPNGTYTLAGLVNTNDIQDDLTICVYVRGSSGGLELVAEIDTDEFRYFEVRELNITMGKYERTRFYLSIANSNILREVVLDENT